MIFQREAKCSIHSVQFKRRRTKRQQKQQSDDMDEAYFQVVWCAWETVNLKYDAQEPLKCTHLNTSTQRLSYTSTEPGNKMKLTLFPHLLARSFSFPLHRFGCGVLFCVDSHSTRALLPFSWVTSFVQRTIDSSTLCHPCLPMKTFHISRLDKTIGLFTISIFFRMIRIFVTMFTCHFPWHKFVRVFFQQHNASHIS